MDTAGSTGDDEMGMDAGKNCRKSRSGSDSSVELDVAPPRHRCRR